MPLLSLATKLATAPSPFNPLHCSSEGHYSGRVFREVVLSLRLQCVISGQFALTWSGR